MRQRLVRSAVCAALLAVVASGCESAQPAVVGGSGGVGGEAGSGPAGGGGAGIGAAGMGGAPGGAIPGCEAADSTVTGSAAHVAAVEVIGAMATCGTSTSCHRGNGKANLSLFGIMDLRTLMVDRPSCFVPAMPLVDGRGGNIALSNSWLWLKLTHPLSDAGTLVPEAAWGTPGAACGSIEPNSFGYRMPWIMQQEQFAPAATLARVRNWICAGAPAP